MKIGLALSGGGAKGLAHIGVLEALNDYGIKPDYIAGTSSGSLVGGLYQAGYTPNEILMLVNRYKDKIIDIDNKLGFKLFGMLIKRKISIKGFVKGNNLENILRQMLKEKGVEDIEDVKRPLAISTVELATGEIVYFLKEENNNDENGNENKNNNNFRSCVIQDYNEYDDKPSYKTHGNLASIIRASCSVPGIFVPKKIEDKTYVDGGVRVNTPTEILKKMGADKVIAVTFDCNKKSSFSIDNVVGISSQAFNIMSHNSNKEDVDNADVNIRLCLNKVSLLDFSNANYIATRGYNIVARNICRIKEKLGLA